MPHIQFKTFSLLAVVVLGLPQIAQTQTPPPNIEAAPDAVKLPEPLVKLLNTDSELRKRFRPLFEKHRQSQLRVLHRMSVNWDDIKDPRDFLVAIADASEDVSHLDDIMWRLDNLLPNEIPETPNAIAQLFSEASRYRRLHELEDSLKESFSNLLEKQALQEKRLEVAIAKQESVASESSEKQSAIATLVQTAQRELRSTEQQLALLLGDVPSDLKLKAADRTRGLLFKKIDSLLSQHAQMSNQFESLLVESDSTTIADANRLQNLDKKVHATVRQLGQLESQLKGMMSAVDDIRGEYAFEINIQPILRHIKSLQAKRLNAEKQFFNLHRQLKNSAATPGTNLKLANEKTLEARLRLATVERRLGSVLNVLPAAGLPEDIIQARIELDGKVDKQLGLHKQLQEQLSNLAAEVEKTRPMDIAAKEKIESAATKLRQGVWEVEQRLVSMRELSLHRGYVLRQIDELVEIHVMKKLLHNAKVEELVRQRKKVNESESALLSELDKEIKRIRFLQSREADRIAILNKLAPNLMSIRGRGIGKIDAQQLKHRLNIVRDEIDRQIAELQVRVKTSRTPDDDVPPIPVRLLDKALREQRKALDEYWSMNPRELLRMLKRESIDFYGSRSDRRIMTKSIVISKAVRSIQTSKATSTLHAESIDNLLPSHRKGSRPPRKPISPPNPAQTKISDLDAILRQKNGPLPTNALYVRVSGNYGSTPARPIEEIVEAGSLFNQRMLQFDDFTTTNIKDVPAPISAESIKLSYGVAAADSRRTTGRGLIATIPGQQMSVLRSSSSIPAPVADSLEKLGLNRQQLKFENQGGAGPEISSPELPSRLSLRANKNGVDIFAHRQPTHFIELALRAQKNAPEIAGAHLTTPMHVVFVVDVSGSMRGQKIEYARQAVIKLYDELENFDSLGIIAFDDEVTTILQSTLKADLKNSDLTAAVNLLEADGGTDIALGISFGIDEVTRNAKPDTLNHIAVFTDGNPTSGEQDWNVIRKQIADKTRGTINLSVFGFGADANRKELGALAGTTGGKFTLVTDPETLHAQLRDNVSRRKRMVALNLQMQIKLPEEFQLLHLFGHVPVQDPATHDDVMRGVEIAKEQTKQLLRIHPQSDIIQEDGGIRLFIPNLVAGETYLLVLEVAASGTNPKSFGSVKLQYVDVLQRQSQNTQVSIDDQGFLPQDLVVEHAMQLWTSEVVFAAFEDMFEKKVDVARDRIRRHSGRLQLVAAQLESDRLASDRVTLNKFGTLLDNLGKPLNVIDKSHGRVQAYTRRLLNEYGRARNGFVQHVVY